MVLGVWWSWATSFSNSKFWCLSFSDFSFCTLWRQFESTIGALVSQKVIPVWFSREKNAKTDVFGKKWFFAVKIFVFCFFLKIFVTLWDHFFFVFLTWITYDPYITWNNCTKILGSITIVRASEVNVLSFSSNALFLHWNFKASQGAPKLYVF